MSHDKSPPSLADIQQAFEDSVFHSDDRVNAWINNDERGDAVKRMNIYRYAYRARLLDVMFIDYPIIHEVLGDDLFVEACQAYLDAYPSTSFSVRWFGRHFAKFLIETEPYAEHPYLAEMARFEWQKGECFDGEDAEPLDLSILSTIPPEAFATMTFVFVPTLRQMTCEYDTPTLWKKLTELKENQQDDDVPQPTKLDTPIGWVLWRRDLAPSWMSLEVDHAWAIQSARSGATFAELCEGLREWIDDEHIPMRMAGFVQTWLAEGMLNRLNFES